MSRLSCGKSYESRKTAGLACSTLTQLFAIGHDPIGAARRRASFALTFRRHAIVDHRLDEGAANPGIGGIGGPRRLKRAFVAAGRVVPRYRRSRALEIESRRQGGFRAALILLVPQEARPWLDRPRDIFALRHHGRDRIGNGAAANRQSKGGATRQCGATAQAQRATYPYQDASCCAMLSGLLHKRTGPEKTLSGILT